MDYLDLRLIPDGLDSRLDALGELRVAAMADDDFAAVIAAFFHILDYRVERFLAAAYLLLYLDRALLAADTDAPEAELISDEADDFAHAAVLDEIVERRESEDDMGVAGIKLRLFNDGLKVRAGLDKLADFFDEQNKLRTRGARVDNGDFLIRLLFEHHIFCGARAVVAAGELARNSDGNDIALLLEFLLPRMRRRTRRVARLCTGVHRVDHSVDIEVAVINKVFISYADSERHGRKHDVLMLLVKAEHITA